MIERAGKVLIDSARATYLETELPNTLWHLYIEIIVYVNNMPPTSALEEGISAIEKMFKAIRFDYKLSVKHIRACGCVSHVKKLK